METWIKNGVTIKSSCLNLKEKWGTIRRYQKIQKIKWSTKIKGKEKWEKDSTTIRKYKINFKTIWSAKRIYQKIWGRKRKTKRNNK